MQEENLVLGEQSFKEFNEVVQKYVEEKYPDYKDNQDKVTELNVDPLERFENLETRRINNLIKVGIEPYKPHVIIHFDGVRKHKSVWRAMRRGHVSVNGETFPNKPFNNRRDKAVNEIKKEVYAELKKSINRC